MKTSKSNNTAAVLDELRTLRKPSFIPYLQTYFWAATSGIFVWREGRSYAVVFFGALLVSFSLHIVSERRSRREIDMVLGLLEAERKTK
jgi:hypothetical protein